MITTTYTLGVIFVMIALFLTIEMARRLANTSDARWVLIILVVGAALTVGLIFIADEPTDKDVLNDRAHYVKVVHQDRGIERVTYRIEWNSKQNHK
jgi:L-cystine uptake protein TcyP (sodium:dicarboxylate symporter family)